MSFTQRVKDSVRVLRGKAAVNAPVEASRPPPRAGALFGMQDTEMSPRQCWLYYKQNAVVAWTIDLIAVHVSSLGIKIKVNGEVVEGHEVEALLQAPGYNRTRSQFIREIAQQLQATGTGYVVSYGNPKYEPQTFDVLHTRDRIIDSKYTGDGWPTAVRFSEEARQLRFTRGEGRDPRYFDKRDKFKELITFYEASSDCRGTGLSKLNGVRTEIEVRAMGMEHNRSLLGNGARPSAMVHFKGSLTKEQNETAREQVQNSLTGPNNTGKVGITSGGDGPEIKDLMVNNRDMDYAGLVKMVEESVFSRFGVPAALYSVDAQTHNNYAVAWHMLYDNAVLPLFDTIYTQFARHWSYRTGEQIEIVPDELSSMVLTEKAIERAVKLSEARLVTPNEARKEIGYEPFAGGDSVYDLPGMIPTYQDLYDDGRTIEHDSSATKPKLKAVS